MMHPKLRAQLEFIIAQLQRRVAFDEAVALAFEERTGQKLPPGGEYSAADAARAQEILAQCWDCDAK